MYHVVVMQNCTGDTRLGLVIVDYESTNQVLWMNGHRRP
jgi:hypothetical protein